MPPGPLATDHAFADAERHLTGGEVGHQDHQPADQLVGLVGGFDAGEHRATLFAAQRDSVSFSSFLALGTSSAAMMRATRRSTFVKSSIEINSVASGSASSEPRLSVCSTCRRQWLA